MCLMVHVYSLSGVCHVSGGSCYSCPVNPLARWLARGRLNVWWLSSHNTVIWGCDIDHQTLDTHRCAVISTIRDLTHIGVCCECDIDHQTLDTHQWGCDIDHQTLDTHRCVLWVWGCDILSFIFMVICYYINVPLMRGHRPYRDTFDIVFRSYIIIEALMM